MVALEQYIPIMLFIMVGAGFGSVLIALGFIAGKRNPDPEKLSPYECGFPEFESARLPFDVRFYLVAILFIIFDLETAFLFPWAVVFKDLSWFGYASMMIFLSILTIGFIFEWKKGALQWE